MNDTLHEMFVNAALHAREFLDGVRIARTEKRRKVAEGSCKPSWVSHDDPRKVYHRAAWYLGWSWEMQRIFDVTPENLRALKNVAEESIRRREKRRGARVSNSKQGL